MVKPGLPSRQGAVLTLLGILMVSHLTFLGFRAKDPVIFQRAAETYVAILLALMTPLAPK
jgi:hypothetical protein